MAGISDNPSLTVVFTGKVGVGKSEAGNFYAGKKVFLAKKSFGGVTINSAAVSCNVAGKNIQIIDTPGFLDAVKPEGIDYKEMAHAFMLARNGVHAFGLVIKSSERCDSSVAKALKEIMVCFPSVIPYIFVIFTHAAMLGENESLQKKQIVEMFEDSNCPQQLKEFLKAINNRYMLLESLDYNNKLSYHEVKCNELVGLIDQIQRERKSNPLSLRMMQAAQNIYNKNPERKDNYLRSVNELQNTLEEAAKPNQQYMKEGQMGQFWRLTGKATCVVLGLGIGTAVGMAVEMPQYGALAGYAIGKQIGDSVCSIQ